MAQKGYAKIPKDLSEIKQKFLFGLTKRQVICFGSGFAAGLPAFFIAQSKSGDISSGLVAMFIVASPFIVCGIYNKNGLFFEQMLKNMIAFFRSPRKRIYRSENAYTMIADEIAYKRAKQKLRTNEQGKAVKNARKTDKSIQKARAAK